MVKPRLYWRIKKDGKWTWERAIAPQMSMADVRSHTRRAEINTRGYGFLEDFVHVPGEEEE